jgi:hypothetical protein
MRDEKFANAIEAFTEIFGMEPEFYREIEGLLTLGKDLGNIKFRLYEVKELLNENWEFRLLGNRKNPIVNFGKYFRYKDRIYKAEVEYMN